jgi:hypothetical protein
MTADILKVMYQRKGDATDTLLADSVWTQVGGFTPSGLSFIQGVVSQNRGTQPTSNQTAFNRSRWLTTSNNFGFNNVHFRNVVVENTFTYNPDPPATGAGGMVNGLIGNVDNNTGNIAFTQITDNAFTDIEVGLAGYRDTHYMAGGGIVGLRATAGSVSTEKIEGNVFKTITVKTTDRSGKTTGAGLVQSAYIEGGGIIGLDAVSSPAKISGHAELGSLSSNLFTGITVGSGDIILGGGVVGVNNNSQNYNDSTYAKIKEVSGNIFGNGATGDIDVSAYYSLRGGGVIGINGLSNAAVQMDFLTNNVFAGIAVESEASYIKGGGIVGLQSNDNDPNPNPKPKEDHTYDPVNDESARNFLHVADNNLFLNAQVTAGTYLDGGGIIGLRANTGAAYLSSLTNNVFKDLTITTKGPDTTDTTYSLRGGGIVGVSSGTQGVVGSVTGNYFGDLKVSTAGKLRGGGILGAQVDSDGDSSSAAILSEITGNRFIGLNVDAGGAILGGGIIGVENPDGQRNGLTTVDNNHFDQITVHSDSFLSGGGVVGVRAVGGHAVIETLTNSQFYGSWGGGARRMLAPMNTSKAAASSAFAPTPAARSGRSTTPGLPVGESRRAPLSMAAASSARPAPLATTLPPASPASSTASSTVMRSGPRTGRSWAAWSTATAWPAA